MKQVDDLFTVDMLPPVKRGRGRPVGDTPAMTAAERKRVSRERLLDAGRGTLTVEISLDVIAALEAFAANKDRAKVETKGEVVDRVLRAYLLRKR